MTTGVPLLDALLRSEVGGQARFTTVMGDMPSTFGTAIEAAEIESGTARRVVWVSNGPHTTFSLAEPKPGTAVVSQRAVDNAQRLHQILLATSDVGEVGATAALRVFLTIATEQALLDGHVDLATRLLAVMPVDVEPPTPPNNAAVGRGPVASGPQALVSETFGLLHELGHLAPDWSAGHLADRAQVLGHLKWAATKWMRPDLFLGDPIERALASEQSSVLGLAQLRSEVHADLFATACLYRAVPLASIQGAPIAWAEFIRETHTAQQVIVAFDRIKRAVSLGAQLNPRYDDGVEMAFHPLTLSVRNLAQQELHVSQFIGGQLAQGRRVGRRVIEKQRRFVHDCYRPLEAHYRMVDTRLDLTIDLLLNKHRSLPVDAAIRRLADQGDRSDYRRTVEHFLSTADMLGQTSGVISQLHRLVGQTSA